MTLDAHHVLTSLELAAAITAGFLFFMALIFLAALPRFRKRWQNDRPARIQMTGPDPVAIRARLAEFLGPYGFQPEGAPGGACSLEPTALRRKLGATAITVVFPAEGEAIVTGQAMFLAMLTADRKVYFLAEGATPFWSWLRKRLTKPFVWMAAILFVALFIIGLYF